MDKVETLLKEQQLKVSWTAAGVTGIGFRIAGKLAHVWSLSELSFASYIVQMVRYFVYSMSVEVWMPEVVLPLGTAWDM